MKRTVRLALLGAVLQGGAHAEELAAQSAPVASSDEAKTMVIEQSLSVPKKPKSGQRKKPRVTAKTAETTSKQAGVLETPTEQQEQTVQLKGVRG